MDKGYDLHTITEKQPIPLETREAVEVAKLIVTSDQKCAVQSAAELMDSLCFIQNSLFKEQSSGELLCAKMVEV